MSLILRRFTEQRRVETPRPDPYVGKSKPRGQPECPTCHAVFRRGKWAAAGSKPLSHRPARAAKLGRAERLEKAAAAPSSLECPACRKKKDGFALGVVEIRGKRAPERMNEIVRTIQRTEKVLRARNDQERILFTRNKGEAIHFYVSLPELASRIGHELEKSFHGTTAYHRSSEGPFVRVTWEPEGDTVNRPTPARAPKRRNPKTWRSRGAKAA